MRRNITITICLVMFSKTLASAQSISLSDLRAQFKNPQPAFRAFYPFHGAAGAAHKETGSIRADLDNIYNKYGYGGVMIAPTTDKPYAGKTITQPGYMKHVGNGLQAALPPGASPWLMTLPKGISSYKQQAPEGSADVLKPVPLPAYLSKEYFDQLKEVLAYSKETGRKVILYDEIGYPSGISNYTTPEKYYRQLLEKKEELVVGPQYFKRTISDQGVLMAVVAMNAVSGKRIDLTPMVKNNILSWEAPSGNWRLMTFSCVTAKAGGGELDYKRATNYLDPEAAKWFVDKVYERHAKEVGKYFGNTLFQTFFDDVGIFDEELTWTSKFNEKFKKLYGKNPALYYPGLWENIGHETDAARIAMFDTRAELLADGFPKVITDWGVKNNIQVSGHCPGNYDPQPVDMNGDPFKFYRAQPIPMVDVIFAYPTGRDGFKLVSDGADYYDKPIVAAETFSSFSPPGKTAGYRRLMELYVRGINRLMGSGLPKSDLPGNETTFAEWVGRTSMLLQGGRRISEIAIFYPIADLEAFYHFDAKEYTKNMRWGTFVPYNNDFMAVGEMLLGKAHRDFTFLHPDFLLSEKIKINGANLQLKNKVNSQNYKVLILPGQTVISLKALQKIKAYYDQGGVIVATSLLPSKASELTGSDKATLANNQQVQAIIKEMFGINSAQPMPEGVSAIRINKKQGRAVFIKKPDGTLLAETLDVLSIAADVIFEGRPSPSSGGGMFSFIHKKKDNRDIFYFANSSDDAVETYANLRGKIHPEFWDPATGRTNQIKQVEYLKINGQDYTRIPLRLMAVTSIFVVSTN